MNIMQWVKQYCKYFRIRVLLHREKVGLIFTSLNLVFLCSLISHTIFIVIISVFLDNFVVHNLTTNSFMVSYLISFSIWDPRSLTVDKAIMVSYKRHLPKSVVMRLLRYCSVRTLSSAAVFLQFRPESVVLPA
jgi:hypothetical protein